MRTLWLAALGAALLAAAPASAQTTKIGYVDMQRALNEIDEGRAARAKLKSEFDQKQKVLNEKQTEFERLRADVEKQASVLSDDARKQKQEDLERRYMELQTTFAQLQRELSEREREVTRGLFDKMAVIIREIAEAEGFAMILERGDGGVVWAQPSLEVTNELVRKYNAKHKGAGAPAAQAPKAGAKPEAKAEAKPAEKKAK